MTCDLLDPMFSDETKAREWLETRILPDGAICPHCGGVNQLYGFGGFS